MSYLYQQSGKNVSLAAGSCLTTTTLRANADNSSGCVRFGNICVGSQNLYNTIQSCTNLHLRADANCPIVIGDTPGGSSHTRICNTLCTPILCGSTCVRTACLCSTGNTYSDNYLIDAGNQCGIKFWNGNSCYTINMSATTSGEAGELWSQGDYNMYFRMKGSNGAGTSCQRGFVWQEDNGSGTTQNLAHLNHQGLRFASTSCGFICSCTGCIKYPIYEARYSNGNTNYRGFFCWNKLQLGNNGANQIIAGDEGCGGRFEFIVNNCADATLNPNGTTALVMCKGGGVYGCVCLQSPRICGTSCLRGATVCATGQARVCSICTVGNVCNTIAGQLSVNCLCSTTSMTRSLPTWSLMGTRYLPQVSASANLPVGWHTIFVNTGSRAGGRFVLRDTTGSRHQYVVFYATHSYGSGNSINVLSYSRYSGQPMQCIRIKDSSTYDGAALQVYVCDACNNLVAYEAGDNIHSSGWYFLTQWCSDASVPYSTSCFNVCWPAGCYCTGASVNLQCIQDGGQILTGKLMSEYIQSTGSLCGHEICTQGWFRNSNSGAGLYNAANGFHFYATGTNNVRIYGANANNIGLQGYSCGAARGCLHFNCSNQIHLYDSGGNARILVNSSNDIRLCNTVCQYGNFVSTGRGYFCSVDESLNFKGARGCFTNQYMHLYNKVGIGHPSGWGCGEGNTPAKGLSTYGYACIGYGCTQTASQLSVYGGVTTCGNFGLKSGTYGVNFYPDNCAFWNVMAGGTSSNVGLRFRDSGGTIDGYVYADGGHIGFLDQASHWAYGHKNDTCHWWNINNTTRMKLINNILDLTSSSASFQLRMFTCNTTAARGSFYANCSNNVGILDSDSNWAIRHVCGSCTDFRIGNNVKMNLYTGCLCHNCIICSACCVRSKAIYGSSWVCSGGNMYANTCVCSPTVCATTVYSNGANMTSMAQGCCFWRFFMVCGDADTFYPVCYHRGNTFGYKRYSMNRNYSSTAPNTWYTSTHKGGLNYTWEQTSDTQWGGNDRSFRVNQVRETYTTVIGGHIHTVSGGLVLLRGGGALYCFASDAMCTSCVCVYDGAGGTDSQGMPHSTCTYFVPGNNACVLALTGVSNGQTCRNSTICNTPANPIQMEGVGNGSAARGCFCKVHSSGHICAADISCGSRLIGVNCVQAPYILATNCVHACCGVTFTHSNWSGEKTKIQAHSNHLYLQNGTAGGCMFFRNSAGSNVMHLNCAGCLYISHCLNSSTICSRGAITGCTYVRTPGYLQTGNHIYAWSMNTQNCITFGVGNAAGDAWIHPLKVCKCGTVVIDNGSNNSSLDAALFICQTSNSDWAQIICKNSGSGTDYGLDLRMGASSTAAMYARFNNTVKFRLQYNCLCHSAMICSPTVNATSICGNHYGCNICTRAGYTHHGLTNLNTTALWSKPAGYMTMVRASCSCGLPSNHGQSYFGYTVTSKRDTGGGYSALLTAYDNSNMWFTYKTTCTVYPTWRKLWHDGNDGSGSGLDADLLDGQHGSYYTNASNLNAGTVATARLGSGTASSSTYLRGDGTWAAVSSGGSLCGSTGSANGSCTTLGYCALPSGTGTGNVAIGFKAMQAGTSGFYNTASGYRAMCCNTTGNNNTAIGMQSLFKNTTGFRNTAVGSFTLYNNTASSNTAVGGCTMQQNTTGSQNTAVGVGVLYASTSGSQNTASGYKSSGNITTGTQNTSMGAHSLRLNTAGGQNVAVGYYAMYNNTGSSNVAIGCGALYNNTTGGNNIGIGKHAGCANTTACNRTYIGNAFTTNTYICGALSKSSGCFNIPHPDPAKREKYDLVHSFVESPTEGDNIYRWTTETTNCRSVIELPDYYRYLNKNDQVWISPNRHFGNAYGEVTEDQKCLIVCSETDGNYNVLLIGTRKDAAVQSWEGPEVLAEKKYKE